MEHECFGVGMAHFQTDPFSTAFSRTMVRRLLPSHQLLHSSCQEVCGDE